MDKKRKESITNQIMKGLSKNTLNKDDMRAFAVRYKNLIDWVDENTNWKLSYGPIGAIGKAVLWYGKDVMKPFCDALKNGNFNGAYDPAHVLWLYLNGRAKYTTKKAYALTVAAIRAYINGRQITRKHRDTKETIMGMLHFAETDIFEWDETFTKMILKSKNVKSKSEIKYAEDDSIIEKEIENAFIP